MTSVGDRQLPATGRVLEGRFHLFRLLGEGGMGAVWAAVDAQTRRWVAIKLLTRVHPDLLARFSEEARILAQLESPHSLKLYDYGRAQDGSPYIVSEILRGRPLNQLIAERGQLSELVTLHMGAAPFVRGYLTKRRCLARLGFLAGGVVGTSRSA